MLGFGMVLILYLGEMFTISNDYSNLFSEKGPVCLPQSILFVKL